MDLHAAVELLGGAIDRRAATVLVGAGLSRGAGLPNWAQLLEPFFPEFEADSRTFTDLPLLAQYVAANAPGRERLVGHIVTAITRPDAPIAPTIDHRLVVALPVDEIWTTNYDDLLERADPTLEVVAVDADYVTRHNGSGRRLHKMHGSIGPGAALPVGGSDALVITRDDYDRYERLHPRAWMLLRAQFLTKSFLFLGFSLNDPNFDAVFRLVRLATPDHYIDHVALLRRDGLSPALFNARCADLLRSGVNVVPIEDVAQITEFLQRLGARTLPQRLYISGSTPHRDRSDGPRPVDDSYPTRPLDTPLVDLAMQVGRALGAHQIKVAAGSELCAHAVYAVLDVLGDDADPDVGWVFRRRRDTPVTSDPRMRKGTIKFIGSDPEEMRSSVFDQIRAVLVIAGGDGTVKEIAQARTRRMGIVPLAISGGTAHATWTSMRTELANHILGGRPIDTEVFERLNGPDVATAIDAAVALVRQALFLAPS